jgi:cold shock CspA family protein
MDTQTYSGRLARWDDDRGFGFIRRDNAKKDIFLHISACKTMGHRPVTGDIISYQIHTDHTGKTRAVNAKIQAVVPPVTQATTTPVIAPATTKKTPRPSHKPRSKLPMIMVIGFFVALAGVFAYQQFDKRLHELRTTPPAPPPLSQNPAPPQ